MPKERSLLPAQKNIGTTVRPLVTEKVKSTKPAQRFLNLTNLGHILTGVWAAAAAIATATNIPLGQIMERQAQTLFFELRGPIAAPSNIVILAIDDESMSQGQFYRADPKQYKSLAALETWPWKRAAYAEAIDKLMAAGARSVALDIEFTTPSSYGTKDDERLRQSLQRYAGRVTLATKYEDIINDQGVTAQLTPIYPRFRTNPLSVGSINFLLEPDSKVHRLGNQYSALLAQDPNFASGLPQNVPDFAEATLKAAQVKPSSSQGDHIFFYGPAGTFKQIPFWHVLDPSYWNNYLKPNQDFSFKNKIVLIGSTAEILQDFLPTPFSANWLNSQAMPGVEIHANAIATLMEGRAIADGIPDRSLQGIFCLVGSIGVGFLLSFPKRPWLRWLLVIVAPLSWGGATYLIFSYGGLILPTALPITAIALSGLSYTFASSTLEHFKKLKLWHTLKKYIDSPLIQTIISQSQQGHVGDLLRERETAILGTKLDGRYVITKVLGSGGFGETYIAEDTRRPGNPQCVVKRLKTATNNINLLEMAKRLFIGEAETLERLGKHDQIPQLLAYFEEKEEFYLVQEFIPGRPLSHELTLGRQLPEAQVIDLLKDLLQVLAFVHSQGVIHRDIKPSNIIRRLTDGKLVLIDFGAVKRIPHLAENDTPDSITVGIGTQGYMPSEQYAGTPRCNSDLYALGITAIQALTGIPPSQFKKDQATEEVLWQHKTEVSHELAIILSKLVRYHFSQRYQSATEVLEALRKLTSTNHSTSFNAANGLSPLDIAYMDVDASTDPVSLTDAAFSTVAWPNTLEGETESTEISDPVDSSVDS
ncbi:MULTISPECIES: serine/threonine-protein kinase [Trichocoleus]|uniref:non-specific serine/threonine protein kinase n=1 Tax=Trichocoleus desertorum GB2-A4 TaxID=2933944 RepID=A0ABV0JBE1_9CYAN|nr:serine/threonine-protein kinase [Trichocoleus sp. FACHB-46]MBD1860881.1 CHASE2 domain-containing protein [Trichocoleus sp. FACHB-46]